MNRTISYSINKWFFLFVYLSFAVDSILKVDVGYKIHIGVLSIVIYSLIFLFWGNLSIVYSLIKRNFWFFLFVFYNIIIGIVKVGKPSLGISIYLILTILVYVFITIHSRKICQKRIFVYFQVFLIVSGLVQFFLFLFFNYQINFLGSDHYAKASSVALRLRGFFVEPNWYAIALSFNTLLLARDNLTVFFKKHPVLSVFTLIVLGLNGGFGPLGMLVLIYSYKYLKKNIIVGIFIIVFSVVIFNLLLRVRASVKTETNSKIELLNYYSRLAPTIRVFKYWGDSSIDQKLFGNGLGSWGTIGVASNLSVLVHKKDPNARDGSELPVFLFELGLIGLFIFFMDLFVLFRSSQYLYQKGGILLFFSFIILYPIVKFWMYMIYYFIMRELINNDNCKQIS